MITVVVVEGNRMVRDSITTMLNDLHDISVLLATDSVADDLLKGVAPRLLLLNIGLANAESLQVASRAREESHCCNVVLMDLSPEHTGIAQLVNAGVAGFILKDATCDEFVQTIRAVADGGSVLPPRMTRSLFAQLNGSTAPDRPPESAEAARLTPREQEVIALIAQGKSNKQIAFQLAVAEHTVKTHVRNVMEKLSLNSRLQIAAYAHRKSA